MEVWCQKGEGEGWGEGGQGMRVRVFPVRSGTIPIGRHQIGLSSSRGLGVSSGPAKKKRVR